MNRRRHKFRKWSGKTSLKEIREKKSDPVVYEYKKNEELAIDSPDSL